MQARTSLLKHITEDDVCIRTGRVGRYMPEVASRFLYSPAFLFKTQPIGFMD